MTWFTFAFLTALSVAVHDTCVKKWFSHLSAYEMFVFPLLYSLPLCAISLLFIRVPPLDQIFYITFLISLPLNAVPFFMYIKAIKISPLSLTVPYLAFTPVFMIGTGFLPERAHFARAVPETHFQFGLPWGKHACVTEALRDAMAAMEAGAQSIYCGMSAAVIEVLAREGVPVLYRQKPRGPGDIARLAKLPNRPARYGNK